MKTLRRLILTAAILFTLLGCNLMTASPVPKLAPTQPGTAANPPEPTPPQAATLAPTAGQATQPAAPNGKPVSIGGIRFILPEAVASEISSQSTTQLELPYINGPADLPQHTAITLGNYHAPGTQLDPHISVFRAADYAQYDERAAQTIAALQSPYGDGQPLPEVLKCQLCAQVHGLKFQNGHGIGMIEQVNTGPGPINNQHLFYYFRGLTDDGQYYVQAVLPLQAPFLAAEDNPNSPLPAGGIPFDGNNNAAYLAAVRQQLDTAATNTFTPSVDWLQALIQSLNVTGL